MRRKITSEISKTEVSDKTKEKCVVYTSTDSKTCTLRVSEDVDNPKNVYRVSLRDYTFQDIEGTTVDMKITKKGIKLSDVTHGGNCTVKVLNDSMARRFSINYGVIRGRALMVSNYYEYAFCTIRHVYACPSSSKYSLVSIMVWYDNSGKGRLKCKISTGPSWYSSLSEAGDVVEEDFYKCKLQVMNTSHDDGHQKAITAGGIDIIKNEGTFNGELNGSTLKIFDNVFHLNITNNNVIKPKNATKKLTNVQYIY